MAKQKSGGAAKIKKTASKVKKTTLKAAADHPLVAEVVAAALVGAAAALKNPDKAKALAASAADELKAASRDSGTKGGALWTLALDIARRSVSSLKEDKPPKAEKPPKPPKAPKAPKPAKEGGKKKKKAA